MKALTVGFALLTFSVIAAEPNFAVNPNLAVGNYEATFFFKGNKPFIRMGGFYDGSNDTRVIPL